MASFHARKALTPAMHGAAGSSKPAGFEGILSVDGDRLAARVLRVRVMRESDNLDAGFYSGDPSGLSATLNHLVDAGVLRVTYGARIRRELLCDLQSGDYYLPPCENITISAARYTPLAGAATPSGGVTVEAEVLPCEAGMSDFRPLTATGWGVLQFGQSAQMRVPAGAYAVDVQTERGTLAAHPTLTDWAFDGTNGPIFEATAGQVYLLRNYQTLVEMPGGMLPLAGPAPTGTLPLTLRVTNRALAGYHVCKALFYIR